MNNTMASETLSEDPNSYLLKNLTNIRRKAVNLPTLENMHVSERVEDIYAQIIAEEDIGEDYGKKAIISERIHKSGQYQL